MVRKFGWVLALVVLAACAPRGVITVMPSAAQVGAVHRIFVGTSRGVNPEGAFDAERAESLHFARYDVSVPPDREVGEITWPPKRGKANPRKQFLTTEERLYSDPAGFRQELAASLRQNKGEAVVFVHGFNNTFSEGLYRLAQMAHDLELPGSVVHYAWPSAAEPLGYAYDRDSALFARDGLEGLLTEIEKAGAKRIILVAHSMGSALMMETLRQISIRGRTDLIARIGGVVLISPDIDVDVFHAQARAVGTLPQPFVVFTSRRDAVLRVSATLSGQKDRLGTLSDVARLGDLPITFLDTAAFNSGAGHFNVGNSPALIKLLEKIASVDVSLDRDRVARTGLLPGAVLTVQNATQIILKPVADIGTAR